MNIAGTGRHINNQVIQLTPFHICYKLPDGAACHWSAPYHGTFFVYQQANAHQLDAITFQRYDKSFAIYFFHHWALATYTKHNRHTGSIYIGIHQSYTCAILRKCEGKVSSYCALAYTALSTHHGYNIFYTRQYLAFI